MRTKTKVSLALIAISITLIIIGSFLLSQDIKKEKIKKEKLRIVNLVEKINSKYSDYVKVVKDTKLYQKNSSSYEEIGTVSNDVNLKLEKEPITENTKYFKIKGLNYYLSYQDVEKQEGTNSSSIRYKNYLPFNENVTTTTTKLYQNEKLIFTLNTSIDTPIIMKDDDKYYIEYNDELFYLKKDEIKTTYTKENTTLEKATSIPITVYHFIYLAGDTSCNEMICHSENQIKEQFNYLKENNYFTITTKEMEYFLDEKINLPKKSILVTIDDGARAEKFIPFLEEYKINATLFLITSWYQKETFASPYLEIASHTNDLHKPGFCPGEQGSPLKCLDKNMLLADLKASRETLNNTEAFCFPFYEYNDYAISIVKEAGFKTAYIGGNIKAKIGTNKLKIPRITILNNTSLNAYKRLIN